jgi:hypothetical protein
MERNPTFTVEYKNLLRNHKLFVELMVKLKIKAVHRENDDVIISYSDTKPIVVANVFSDGN